MSAGVAVLAEGASAGVAAPAEGASVGIAIAAPHQGASVDAAAEPAPKRSRRSSVWPPGSRSSPWSIAEVMSKGQHIGWGASCRCHRNAADVAAGKSTECKKQLPFAGLSSEETRLRVMAWLVAGSAIGDDDDGGRSAHLKIKPRELPLLSEADYVAQALAVWP